MTVEFISEDRDVESNPLCVNPYNCTCKARPAEECERCCHECDD